MLIRMTSKRQATFPAAVCDQLGLTPGDAIELEPRLIDGEQAWILRPRNQRWNWVGALRDRIAPELSHDLADIRRSIDTAWGADGE